MAYPNNNNSGNTRNDSSIMEMQNVNNILMHGIVQQQPPFVNDHSINSFPGLPANDNLTSLHDCFTVMSSAQTNPMANEPIVAELRRITESLNEIKLFMTEVNGKVDALFLQRKDQAAEERDESDEDDMTQIAETLGIPVSTTEDFHSLESDKKKLSLLKKYLVDIGGLELQSALREFLKATMTDEFVSDYIAWSQGDEAKGKINFGGTKINLTFFGACRRLKRLKTPSVEEYEASIKKNIKNAIQRHYMATTKNNRQKSGTSSGKKGETAEEKNKRYEAA